METKQTEELLEEDIEIDLPECDNLSWAATLILIAPKDILSKIDKYIMLKERETPQKVLIQEIEKWSEEEIDIFLKQFDYIK